MQVTQTIIGLCFAWAYLPGWVAVLLTGVAVADFVWNCLAVGDDY